MVRELPTSPKYSFDEYKLYYESTEKVTDRRLAANTWNYGICTAIIGAIAALANWSTSRPEFGLITICAVGMLAGMGVLLCALWIGQIRDFKALNNAKFDVLNEMAPLVNFGSGDERISAVPFDREWKSLEAKKATREVEGMKIFALQSSNTEFLVPKAFRCIFFVIIIAGISIAVVNLPLLTNSVFVLRNAGQATVAAPMTKQ